MTLDNREKPIPDIKPAGDPSPAFGHLLKRRRKALDLTQKELAARVGCSTVTIQKIEEGRRRPSREIAALLVRHLDVPVAEQAAFLSLARGVAGVGEPVSGRPRISRDPGSLGNLPTPLTPLLGRADEVTALRTLLDRPDTRLITLVGPPGVGKTRMALAAAAEVQDRFVDGVWFVALAPVLAVEWVLPALARVLGVVESGAHSLEEALLAYLRSKTLLLVLDNFDSLLETGPRLTALLQGAPRVKMLVTSREPLRVYGEQRFPITPLTAPVAADLFVQRAQAIRYDFVPTPEETGQIEALCGRLDRLPLAIELAAAHVERLTPAQLLQQIGQANQRLVLAAVHAHDLPPQHQTLRHAIAWSYAQLNPDDQTVLARLSVFAGGFDERSAAALLEKSEPTVAPILRTLLEKSLLQSEQTANGVRYTLLETVREFCLGQLQARDELNRLQARHARYFLDLALASTALQGQAKHDHLDHLELEIDNLSAALHWCLGTTPETAVRMATALRGVWYDRGRFTEGRNWLARALAAYPAATALRARALVVAAQLARRQNNLAAARQLAEEGLALARRLDTLPLIAEAQTIYGWVIYDQHDRPRAIEQLEASADLYRRLDDRRNLALVLTALVHWMGIDPRYSGRVGPYAQACLALAEEQGDPETTAHALKQVATLKILQGHYEQARAMCGRAVQIFRDLRVKPNLGWALEVLGEAHWLCGELEEAQRCYLEAHAIFDTLDDAFGLSLILHHLGQVARRQGHATQAGQHYRQALAMSRQMHNVHMMARCLAGLGGVALLEAQPAGAAVLLAAAQCQFDRLVPFLAPADQADIQQMMDEARAGLVETEFAASWARGTALSLDEAIDLALASDEIDGYPFT